MEESSCTPTESASNISKPKGKARKCLRCPGNPLLASAECKHSALWRKVNRPTTNNTISAVTAASPATEPNSSAPSVTAVDAGVARIEASVLGSQFALPHAAAPGPALITPDLGNNLQGSQPSMDSNSLGFSLGLPAPLPLSSTPISQHSPLPAQTQVTPMFPTYDLSENPFIVNSNTQSLFSFGDNSSSAPLSRASDFGEQLSAPVLSPCTPSQQQPTVQFTPSGPSSSGSPTPKSKRTRISYHNPAHGFVCGVGRGRHSYMVPRPRVLPGVRKTTDEQSRRFRTLVKDVIARCERLGAETNCWLYIGAQHPSARGPFVHFASERLRREGPSALDELHSNADRLFTSLISARRQETAELSLQVQQLQEEKAALEREKAEWKRRAQETAEPPAQ